MSLTLAVVALAVGAAGAAGWRASVRRVARLEARVSVLERELRRELLPALDRSTRASGEALDAARRAARAAGIEEPPPRLAAEGVTGPVVRAVAFGAGAKRALARMTADLVPRPRTRDTTRRVVSLAIRGRAGSTSPGKPRTRRRSA